VALVPPAGTLPINNLPVASFSISPAIGNINETLTFDASATKDEGEPCNALCSYQWNFGDFEPGSGMVVTHAYSRAHVHGHADGDRQPRRSVVYDKDRADHRPGAADGDVYGEPGHRRKRP
jgi:hypothetical protein